MEISDCRHAYSKGSSVETALYKIFTDIGKSLASNEQTLGIFLDIEGAINNVIPEAIAESLLQVEMDRSLVDFARLLLNRIIIHSEMGEAHIIRYATRGTPQGGALYPMLWSLTINTLHRA